MQTGAAVLFSEIEAIPPSERRNDPGGQRRDSGKQRNSTHKGTDVLFRVLIAFLFRQERKANALCAAPPEQIDHHEIKQPQPFSKRKEIPERRPIAVQPQRAAEGQPNRGKHDGKEQQIARQNGGHPPSAPNQIVSPVKRYFSSTR